MSFVKKIKNIIGYIRHPRRMLCPNTYSSERFCEYLKSKGARIGKNTRFINPSQCHVDPGRIDYITIGCNCCLSYGTFLAHDYSWYTFLDAFGDIVPDPGGEIVIGNNVFVGYQAVILKGTHIGDNVIIGARSVVKGNIPSNTVWAGCPARMICSLDEFYKRKKNGMVQSALKRRNFIRKKYNRFPTISEMGLFSFLFLERTEETYNNYIRNIEFNGRGGDEKIKDLFFGTKPIYSSFEDFLKSDL